MARRRFYAAPDDINGSTINLAAEEAHHLIRVLRLKPGDEAFVFDGCGREYRCRYASAEGSRARLEIVDRLDDEVESPLRLTLAQALAKGEKFDLIVQKATELGASRIAPIAADHCDVKLSAESAEKKLERWRRISLEALKQCGRRALVEITAPVSLAEMLDELSERTMSGATAGAREAIVVFSERGGVSIKEVLSDIEDRSRVTVFVGPEGGWSDAETALLDERGVKAVTLGPRVLRAETAALVAVTLLQHASGDLSSRPITQADKDKAIRALK